ncbi:inositol 1,4,5-trisphosphate receptor type 2-like [Dysidea avara]|uniref:inositol 1,4,5-trisphosphate receptor type 2-like n=1 Tax=Dysidea avara TaxID=196820 RepID=UPI003317E970
MLNGKNDKLYPDATPDENKQFTMEERFEDNNENRAIFKMKVKALKVMDLFFNFRFYLRLQHFIYDYRLLKGDVDLNEIIGQESDDEEEKEEQTTTEKYSRGFGRFLPTPAPLQQLTSGITQQVTNVTHQVTHQVTNMKQQVTCQVSNVAQQVTQLTSDLIQRGLHSGAEQYTQPPDELKAFQQHAHELKVYNNDRLMDLVAQRLKKIFSLSFYKCDGPVENGQRFHDILIDLSKYKDDELLHECLHLLGRFYSAEENLFEKAIQTQLLITSESETVYSRISSLLPTLRHLAVIDVDEKQCQELVDILEELTSLCHLEGDENEPHKQNQTILYNTGVFADVLNLIFWDKSTRQIGSDGKVEIATQVDSSDMKQREEVLSKCLKFLRLLAKNNQTVQERLFDHMDDLLKLDVAIPDMAEVLTEIFTGGQEICLKLKEQQVEQVFYLIAYGGEVGRAELLGTLQAAVKVEHLDLPLKRNQAYIMKYFGKMRDKFCNELLGLEEGKVKRREQLLVNAIDEDPDLMMLLKLIDLLASCSEGENLFIESICQNIMSINELLKILSFHDLSPPQKKPFVRFLLWVYMNTGGDKMQTGSILLFHDGKVWAFLEHIRILLDGIVRALKGLPESEVVAARSSLTAQSVKLKRRRDGQRKRASTMSAVTNVPFVTNKEGELVPGLLIYLMEGIVPMLKVFYAEYFRPFNTSAETTGDSDERISSDREIQISAEIAIFG